MNILSSYDGYNRSFLELENKLISEGVENTKWLDLPRDSQIRRMRSYDDKIKTSMLESEVKDNLFFFLNHFLKVKTLKNEIKDFAMNPATMAELFLAEKGLSVLVNNPRQTYGTTTQMAFALWNLISCPERDIHLVTGTVDMSRMFKQFMSEMNEILPDELKVPKKVIDKKVNTLPGFQNRDRAIQYAGVVTHDEDSSEPFLPPLVLVSDSEVISYGDVFIETLLPNIEKGTVQLLSNSCTGKDKSWSKKNFDKMIMNSIKWITPMYDMKTFPKRSLYYIKYNYTEMYENPKEMYDFFKTNTDIDTMNQELLLKR